MLTRLWWFLIGVAVGSALTVRALQRRPSADDLRRAAVRSGADLLDLAARVVRPPARDRGSAPR